MADRLLIEWLEGKISTEEYAKLDMSQPGCGREEDTIEIKNKRGVFANGLFGRVWGSREEMKTFLMNQLIMLNPWLRRTDEFDKLWDLRVVSLYNGNPEVRDLLLIGVQKARKVRRYVVYPPTWIPSKGVLRYKLDELDYRLYGSV